MTSEIEQVVPQDAASPTSLSSSSSEDDSPQYATIGQASEQVEKKKRIGKRVRETEGERPQKLQRTDRILYKGGKSEREEETLFEKDQVIAWCLEKGYIISDETKAGSYAKNVDAPEWVKMESNRQIRIRNVVRWSSLRKQQRWQDFAQDKNMQRHFGESPLKARRRIPRVWLQSFGRQGGSGRSSFLDKYPAFAELESEMKRFHAEARHSLSHDDFDMDFMYRKFLELVNKINEKKEDSRAPMLIGDRTDRAFSFSFVRLFCERIGLDVGRVGSLEPKKIGAVDNKEFRQELVQKMLDNMIDGRAIQLYAERKDFFRMPRKSIIAVKTETKCQSSLNKNRRQSSLNKNRRHPVWEVKTHLTVALTYGYSHKGVVMVMTETVCKETVELINRHFGRTNMPLLVLISNMTGNCYGTCHVNDVIPRVLSRSATRARKTLQLKDDAPVLQLQEHSLGHCSDTCTITQVTGLVEQRTQKYYQHRLVNHVYSDCGTPEQCCNDRLFQYLKAEVDEEMRCLNIEGTDLNKMRDEVSPVKGGSLEDMKGYTRNRSRSRSRIPYTARQRTSEAMYSDLYIFCLALARVWYRMPQEKLSATFVELGYYDDLEALRVGKIATASTS